MTPADVVPQGLATECVYIGTDAEAVAGVEHDPHRLVQGGHEEGVALGLGLADEAHIREPVLPLRFGLLHLNSEAEGPKGVAGIGVETFSLDFDDIAVSACSMRLPVCCRVIHGGMVMAVAVLAFVATDATQVEHWRGRQRLAAPLGDDQRAAVPSVAVHLAIVEQGSADDVLAVAGSRGVGGGWGRGRGSMVTSLGDTRIRGRRGMGMLDVLLGFGSADHDGLKLRGLGGIGRYVGFDSVAVEEIGDIAGFVALLRVARLRGRVTVESRALLVTPAAGGRVGVFLDTVEVASVVGSHGTQTEGREAWSVGSWKVNNG